MLCHNDAQNVRKCEDRFRSVRKIASDVERRCPVTQLNGGAVAPRAELSHLALEAADWRDALAQLADHALAAGFVRDSFKDALIGREEKYPTGLPTAVPVAIPHADVEHVLRPGLAVAVLKNPVDFGEMGGADDASVAARVLVMILVTEPHDQVEQLSRLIGVFQQDGWYEALARSTSAAELTQKFTDLLSVDA